MLGTSSELEQFFNQAECSRDPLKFEQVTEMFW